MQDSEKHGAPVDGDTNLPFLPHRLCGSHLSCEPHCRRIGCSCVSAYPPLALCNLRMYRPLIFKESIVDGVLDEDLYRNSVWT